MKIFDESRIVMIVFRLGLETILKSFFGASRTSKFLYIFDYSFFGVIDLIQSWLIKSII